MAEKKLDQVALTSSNIRGMYVEATLQRHNIVPYIQSVLMQPRFNVEQDNNIVRHFTKTLLPDIYQHLLKPSKSENMPRIEMGVLWNDHSHFALFLWDFREDHAEIHAQWYEIAEVYEWSPDIIPDLIADVPATE